MGKLVKCKRCGGKHYLYQTRERLPYFYCDVQREIVWLYGPRPGVVIRRPMEGDRDER